MLSLCAAVLAAGLNAAPLSPPPQSALLLQEARAGAGNAPAGHEARHDAGSAVRQQVVASGVPGRYPEGSTRALTPADLQHMSLEELRLMRNEILARHGYLFPAPEVDGYFRKQPWYEGRLRSVAPLLSETERANLDTIRTYEAAQGAPLDLVPASSANAAAESPPERKPGIAIPRR